MVCCGFHHLVLEDILTTSESICLLFAKNSIVCPSDTAQEVQHEDPGPFTRGKKFALGDVFLTIYWFSWFHTLSLPARDKCPLILLLARCIVTMGRAVVVN